MAGLSRHAKAPSVLGNRVNRRYARALRIGVAGGSRPSVDEWLTPGAESGIQQGTVRAVAAVTARASAPKLTTAGAVRAGAGVGQAARIGPVQPTSLTAVGNTASSQTQTSPSFTPTANTTLLVVGFVVDNNHNTARTWSITNTGGLQFIPEYTGPENDSSGANFSAQVQVWKAAVGPSPASMTVTIDAYAGTQLGFYATYVWQLPGVSPHDIKAQAWAFDGDPGTTTAPALGSTPLAGRTLLATFFSDAAATVTWAGTPSGWTRHTEVTTGGGAIGLSSTTDADGALSYSYSSASTISNFGTIVELIPAGSPGLKIAGGSTRAAAAATARATATKIAGAATRAASAVTALITGTPLGGGPIAGAVTSIAAAVARITGTKLATSSTTAPATATARATQTKVVTGGAVRAPGAVTGRPNPIKVALSSARATAATTARAATVKLAGGATRATTGTTARATGTKTTTGATVLASATATARAAGSKLAGGATTTAAAVTALMTGSSSTAVAGAVRAVVAVVARVTGTKLAQGTTTAPAAVTGRSQGSKLAAGAGRALAGATSRATGTKLAAGAGRAVAAVSATASGTKLATAAAVRSIGAAFARLAGAPPGAPIAGAVRAIAAAVARITGTKVDLDSLFVGRLNVLLQIQSLVRVQPAVTTDAYGNEVLSYGPAATRTSFEGWVWQSNRGESRPDGRNPAEQIWELMCNESTFDTDDRIEWPSGHPAGPITFAIEGPPQPSYRAGSDAIGPAGFHHTELTMRLLEG